MPEAKTTTQLSLGELVDTMIRSAEEIKESSEKLHNFDEQYQNHPYPEDIHRLRRACQRNLEAAQERYQMAMDELDKREKDYSVKKR